MRRTPLSRTAATRSCGRGCELRPRPLRAAVALMAGKLEDAATAALNESPREFAGHVG
ncbi:hypothetical protein [Actinacidiphila sp. bgisy160]|uniref:hypothetical protein n=1 Tax=Actinacidiphila sp. bgisy160 TaxID=3413796 RepID=UPI003D743C4F